MTLPKHPQYTEVYLRSYDAIVRYGLLEEVAFALLVDPLEAEDLSERIGHRTDGRLMIRSLDALEPPSPAPSLLSDAVSMGSKAVSALLITLGQWVKAQTSAEDALVGLFNYDTRVSMFCAGRVVEHVMDTVLPGDSATAEISRAIRSFSKKDPSQKTLNKLSRTWMQNAQDSYNILPHGDLFFMSARLFMSMNRGSSDELRIRELISMLDLASSALTPMYMDRYPILGEARAEANRAIQLTIAEACLNVPPNQLRGDRS